MKENLEVLLQEKRVFKPSKELAENSNVMKWMKKKKIKSYEELLKKAEDIEWFWKEAAKETVKWKKPFKRLVAKFLSMHRESKPFRSSLRRYEKLLVQVAR